MSTYTVTKRETVISRTSTTAPKTWDNLDEVLERYMNALKEWEAKVSEWQAEHVEEDEYSEIAICKDAEEIRYERETWIIFKGKPGTIFGSEVLGNTFKDPFVGELTIEAVESRKTRTNLIPPNWSIPTKPEEPVIFPRTIGNIREVTQYLYGLIGAELPYGHFEEVPNVVSTETVTKKIQMPGRPVWPELGYYKLQVTRRTAEVLEDSIQVTEEVIDRRVTEVERISTNVSDHEMSENMFGRD